MHLLMNINEHLSWSGFLVSSFFWVLFVSNYLQTYWVISTLTHRENFAECIPRKIGKLEKTTLKISEIVIHEKIRLVCLLDLTADFGVKTNADFPPISQI